MSEEPDVSSLPDRREREAQGNPCVQVQWQRLGVRAAVSSEEVRSGTPLSLFRSYKIHASLGDQPGPQ